MLHPHSQTSLALESYQWQEGLPATLPGVEREGIEVALFEERVREAVEQGGGIERLKGKSASKLFCRVHSLLCG